MAFINFYIDLDTALSTTESPITRHFVFGGVQLIPGSTNPYTQFTETPEGVELEDWEVFAVDLKTSQKTDISDKFAVFGNFTDTNGFPQIIWTLTDLPDLGGGFVYLEVNQTFGATYYTNTFKVTSLNSEFTARFDYKNKLTDYWQSIQLNTWYRQDLNRDELTTYYEVSTNNTVTTAIKKTIIEKWFTGILSNDTLVKMRDMLNSTYKYVNLTRFHLYEAFEIPELSQNQNFAQQNYLISLNKNDILTENVNEMSILTDIELIFAILKPVTDGGVIWIWDRPANEIPAGYEEELNIAGKTIFGRLEGDATFGTLGAGIGNSTIPVLSSNLPEHVHRMFVNASTDISSNRLNNFADRNVTYRGTGEGSADHDYTMSSSVIDPTLGFTGKSGEADPDDLNILNPGRIVNFIKWVGLP